MNKPGSFCTGSLPGEKGFVSIEKITIMYLVKSAVVVGIFTIMLAVGCSKEPLASRDSMANLPKRLENFTRYRIPGGEHYATSNPYQQLNTTDYRFQVYFDSSAIYDLKSIDQLDINKLSGFADNGGLHQDYSARFGWRWSDHHLRLFAYVHNAGKIESKEVTPIEIGRIYTCSIVIAEGEYIFKVEEPQKMVSMKRGATTISSQGYRLYPYFGGNVAAPHDIRIWINYPE